MAIWLGEKANGHWGYVPWLTRNDRKLISIVGSTPTTLTLQSLARCYGHDGVIRRVLVRRRADRLVAFGFLRNASNGGYVLTIKGLGIYKGKARR